MHRLTTFCPITIGLFLLFLNVGTAGPNFIRTSSSIDGISMVQSSSLQLGRDYEFQLTLKARRPGRYHVHPIVSVEGAGTMVGPGVWIDVRGSQEDFVNEVETMFGRKIDLETFNLNVVYSWHILWFLIGGAWVAYWLRKQPILVGRMRAVDEAEADGGDADILITNQDRKVAAGFAVLSLLVVIGGYQWAESEYPVTTPLRTAKTVIPEKDPPAPNVEVTLDEALYRIPGRSFQMSLTVENLGNDTLSVGEFLIANLRFINPSVKTITPQDSHDLVAPQGLRVEGGTIGPGETKAIKVFAEDALWETQRLTHMINDPDSIIAGLLFFEGENGTREVIEVGGSMLPVFN